VHFLRYLRGRACRDRHDALGAVIRSIFTARDGAEARRRLRDASASSSVGCGRSPPCARSRPDVLAFYRSPTEHWAKIRSTNRL
jgi:transposase-like protein